MLLDTCTLMSIALDAQELSQRARAIFTDPTNEVFLSVVSVREVAVKYTLGRLPLPEPPDPYVLKLRAIHGIDSLPLDELSVLHLPRLPKHHRDPFDRMLVCQAIAGGMIILIPDEMIRRYPARTAW